VTDRPDHALEDAPACLEFLPDDAPSIIRNFAKFWIDARGEQVVPLFSDLDPVEMPWALEAVFVVERRDDGVLAYRLVGELMSDRLGGKLIGKTAAEVFEREYAARVNARWNRVLDEPALCFAETRHLTRAGRVLRAQRFLAPARSSSGAIDRVIGVSSFDKDHLEIGSGIDDETEMDVRWLAARDIDGAG
jgi:hypothetical protein